MPEPQGASRPAASFCQRMEKACLMQVVYEDNHIIIVNKQAGEIVQGDRTGDRTLADDVKAYIKERYAKPGEVFLGTVHRLDRPAQGLVLFAGWWRLRARARPFRALTTCCAAAG